MNGEYDGRKAIEHGGIGRSTTLQLYILLHLFDVLMWTEIGASEPAAATLRKKKRATLMMGKADAAVIIKETTDKPKKRSTKTFPFKPAGDGNDGDEKK